MRFKRLLMPMLVLGLIFTMGNMAYAQVVTCSISASGAALTTVNGGGASTDLGTANAATSFPAVGATARATATGHTEPVAAGLFGTPPNSGGGRVRVTCVNADPLGVGPAAVSPGVLVFTISYVVPITNTQSHPSTAAGIRIMNGTGAFFAAGPGATSAATTLQAGANVGISAVNSSAGTIVIGVGTPVAVSSSTSPQNPTTGVVFAAGSTSTFDVEGVLVSTNGKTGAIAASLTTTGGVNIGTGSAEVITAVLNGIVDPTVPTGTLPTNVTALGPAGTIAGGAAVLSSSGAAVKNNFTIRIQENYQDLFREASQFNNPGVVGVTGGAFPQSPSSDVVVNVILKDIPAGLTISGCAAVLTDTSNNPIVGGTPTVSATNITVGSPILTVNFNSLVDLTAVDVLWVTCTNVAVGSAVLPLPSTAVTAQVTLAPVGAALSSTSGALTTLSAGQIPRYQQALQPATPLTVVVFPAANTVLLTTFAFVGPGYNTGLAIANTTTDPFGTAAGGAVASEGTVSFLLVKNDGTTKTYTTGTGSPGGGLTGAGVVKTGSTYVVNLSEILGAASFGTTFTGYVFVTANFTHAHGAATIYTTSNGAAALSTPVLVMPSVSSAVGRGTPEQLGF